MAEDSRQSNNIKLSLTFVLGWGIGLGIIVGGLWYYPTVAPNTPNEILSVLLIRAVLGTFMVLFLTTAIMFIDGVLDGWWLRKVAENAWTAMGVVLGCLFLIGAAMRLYW